MLAQARVGLRAPFMAHPARDDGRAPLRRSRDLGDVEVAIDGLRERARNRRRGHVQYVRRMSAEGAALFHTEAVLLVDYGDREVLPLDAFLDESVRSDDHVGVHELPLEGT